MLRRRDGERVPRGRSSGAQDSWCSAPVTSRSRSPRIAAGCGFDVTVVDSRSEWPRARALPWARLEVRAPEDFGARVAERRGRVRGDRHPRSRARPASWCRRCWIVRSASLGMIGSVPEAAEVRAAAQGARLLGGADRKAPHPLGPRDRRAQTPEEIAVSVRGRAGGGAARRSTRAGMGAGRGACRGSRRARQI